MDRTIFDTEKSGEKRSQCLAEISQKTVEEIEKINSDYKLGLKSSTDFDPNEFLTLVSKKTEIDFEILNQTVFQPQNFVLYPETKEKLNKSLNEGYSLGIFSEGVSEWQMKKLILTGIIDYFDPSLILIEKRKLSAESINKIPNGATIVDDKKEVIEKLHPLKKFKLFWLNRVNSDEFPGVKTIKSLLEVAE